MSRRITPALAALLVLLVAAPARAGIWSAIASQTTDDIAALSYRADALRYATPAGQIYRRAPDGSVTREASFTGRRFFDLAMSPDGTKGLAAADGGRLYRLQNGTWSSVSL